MLPDLSVNFPRYTEYDPAAPIYCVTPELDGCFHRFFDTSPISPSGRYVGLTRLLAEDRMPAPGDPAEVVLVDLQSGEARVLCQTRGWDTQLGAQVQWGPTDEQLFFNDMDTAAWRPYCVVMNPLTGERRELQGTVYMASPDGTMLASPCLRRTGTTQAGYGVLVPAEVVPANVGAPDDDGLFITDVPSGESRLLISFAQIAEMARPHVEAEAFSGGDFYGFHVKWNPQGTRLMSVLRRRRPDVPRGMLHDLLCISADGSEVHVTVPASEWSGKGGHHPNWCPDGERAMMNLKLDGQTMRFVQVRYDGSGLRTLSDTLLGSGHPAMHPDGRHIVTDNYPQEPLAFGDGTVPMRLCDIQTGEDLYLCRIQTVPPYNGEKGELRVDPHPAWDYSFTRVAFNACPDGTRRLYIADLAGML